MTVLNLIDRYRVSWLIVLCSMWAAFVLWHPPSNFAAFPLSFYFVWWLSPDERIWAALFGVSALPHGVGLGLFMVGIDRPILRVMRFAGLSGEFFLWTLFSGATLTGNPDALFGITGVALSILAGRLLANFGGPDNA